LITKRSHEAIRSRRPIAEYARDRSGLGSAHARMPIIRFCARCCGDEGGR
jgi:hypothetical protein